MLLTVLIGLISAAIVAALVAGAIAIRRHQSISGKKREAAQLQRRADHLFKIALAAQVHARNDSIARSLLEEAVRVLEYSAELDPHAALTANSLRECRELIASIDAEPKHIATEETPDPVLEFPETELIEAQLHLTEAGRLLIGLEKRGQISYDALSEMAVALKQAQRAIDLRLQLHQATHSLSGDRNNPKHNDAQSGEYFSAQERNRTQSLR